MRRAGTWVGLVATAVAGWGASGASAAPGLRMTADPPLRPGFASSIADYVVSCRGADPVSFRVSAPPGTRVAVGRGRPRSGVLSAAVALRPGRAVTIRSVRGRTRRAYHVRCLPPDFPAWTVERTGRTQAGWYVLTPTDPHSGYVAVFGDRGVPVWWMKPRITPLNASLLPDGTLAWSRTFGGTFGSSPEGGYEVHGLDGRLRRLIRAVGEPTDTHDLQVERDGRVLLLAYAPRDHVDLSPYGGPADATVVDAEIQELDRRGRVTWRWSSRTHLSPAEAVSWMPSIVANPTRLPDGRLAYDLVHINSVQAVGDEVVFSARHLDAVLAVDRRTKDVLWKLGGTRRRESLQVLGDRSPQAPGLDGQHDARLGPDGTLTVHDNGTLSGRAPRARRFRLDLGRRTAREVERVTGPADLSAWCCGSARRLAGGDWVVSWGGTPRVGELRPDGRPVLLLRFGTTLGAFSYRALPVARGRLDARALRAGMDAMDVR